MKNGGAVLATSINKYCYLTCRYLPPFFDHRYRVVWSRIENCRSIDEIAHPAVRETLRYLEFDRGVEVHHDGDLPARSGIGSSSSFTVGLLHALYALKGMMCSPAQLAAESIYIEQDILGEAVGSQDQCAAAHGGFNYIRFMPGGQVSVSPMAISRERTYELNAHLMLFYSGIKRTAANIAHNLIEHIDEKAEQLRRMHEMAEEGAAILNSNEDIARFGELLHDAWQVKREMADKVTNPEVDELYEAAREAGALGGKLAGAGGGGFMLLFVRPKDQPKVREKLRHHINVPFVFESGGSQIIFFDREEDFGLVEAMRARQKIDPFRELDDATEPSQS